MFEVVFHGLAGHLPVSQAPALHVSPTSPFISSYQESELGILTLISQQKKWAQRD